jgi:hypothetical protein
MQQIRASLPSSEVCAEDSQKASASLIAERIEVLFSAYRRDDYADPLGFVAQLGAVLSEYPPEVVLYVTDPLTGVQRRQKWPPSMAEVIEACDEHVAYLAKIAQGEALRRAQPVPIQPPPRREGTLTYAEVLKMGVRPIGRFETVTPKRTHPRQGAGREDPGA